MMSPTNRYHAHCPALKGCHTWGRTRDEAIDYIGEAVELYVEELIKAGDPIPGVGWADKVKAIVTTAA